MSISDILCDQLFSLITLPLYQGLLWAYFFCSLAALVLLLPIVRNFSRMSIFHPNLKFLIYFNIFYTSLFSCVMLSALIHAFFYFFTYKTECEIVFQVKHCFWGFAPVTWSLTGMCVTQGCMSLERHVSTVYAEKYESTGKRFGYVLAITNILLTSVLSFYGLSDTDTTEGQTICIAMPVTAARTTNHLFMTLIAMELISIILFSYDWRYNKIQSRIRENTLGAKFQILENMSAIKFALPLTLIHFFLMAFYITSTIILRTYINTMSMVKFRLLCCSVYVIPYYVVLQNIYLLTVIYKQKKERLKADAQRTSDNHKSRTIYFSELENQWNTRIVVTK